MTTVRRVPTENGGTRIEPPLDRSLPPLDQLRWHAAATSLDTGLAIAVEPAGLCLDDVPVEDHFLVYCARASCGPLDFNAAWTFLNGIYFGARLARRGG